jgi:hypothetical protein
MKKKITLGKEVMVSDPCYEVPTWCQIKVKNVQPGQYVADTNRIDLGDWGGRIGYLTAIHEDYITQDLKWSTHDGEVGVDSGQAGIFSMETYRDDSKVDEIGLGEGDISFFGNLPDNFTKENGQRWYQAMCSRTLGKQQWGTYSNGVVSSSGLGDGSYVLYVARANRKVVGFMIDFGIDEEGTFPPNKKKNKLHPML